MSNARRELEQENNLFFNTHSNPNQRHLSASEKEMRRFSLDLSGRSEFSIHSHFGENSSSRGKTSIRDKRRSADYFVR